MTLSRNNYTANRTHKEGWTAVLSVPGRFAAQKKLGYDSGMTDSGETQELPASTLCKSCGLCCTGHLFIWAKLRPSELDPAEALGLTVFRSDPTQRGFSQPCPLWQGQCTIYDTSHYPHICRAYRCKLLKEVSAETASLSVALTMIDQAKEMIRELETMLPLSTRTNFRERLVAELENPSIEHENLNPEFRKKAEALLAFYDQVFGVNDLVERNGEE